MCVVHYIRLYSNSLLIDNILAEDGGCMMKGGGRGKKRRKVPSKSVDQVGCCVLSSQLLFTLFGSMLSVATAAALQTSFRRPICNLNLITADQRRRRQQQHSTNVHSLSAVAHFIFLPFSPVLHCSFHSFTSTEHTASLQFSLNIQIKS